MRSLLVGITLASLVCAPSVVSAQELKQKVVEQFNENCSAVQLTLITLKTGQNVVLKKGGKSKYIPLNNFGTPTAMGNPPLPLGEMEWFCGSTMERSECDSGSTHVRVERAASGRSTKFTCYAVESCTKGQTKLETLDDRCGEETLRVGGQRIKFLEKKENIPFSSAKLNNSGGVRWYCGDTAERSNCPANTTLLTVERKDRDNRLFHIQCLRAGLQCERHDGAYPPKP